MAVPSFQAFMLPELQLLSDGAERTRKEILYAMPDIMGLATDDLSLMLPSGKAPLFRSRGGWALVYMSQAGLVERVKRGTYRISERGKALLATNPTEITLATLESYPEFLAFRARSRKVSETSKPAKEDPTDSATSPEEQLQAGYQAIRSELIDKDDLAYTYVEAECFDRRACVGKRVFFDSTFKPSLYPEISALSARASTRALIELRASCLEQSEPIGNETRELEFAEFVPRTRYPNARRDSSRLCSTIMFIKDGRNQTPRKQFYE